VSKRETLPKSGYFSAVVFSRVKMVADRHRPAVYHNKHWDELFRNVNIKNLE